MGIIEFVQKWILRAQSDLKTAKDEILMKDPATDTICFHCQQSVEKYLKAFLTFYKIRVGKTHNLALLIKICKEIDSDFERLYEIKADTLTPYATGIIYPEDFYFPSFEEAMKQLRLQKLLKFS